MVSVAHILVELAFFSTLALLSECARRLAERRGVEAAAAALRVSTLVCSWYSVSVTLTLYNKWLVSTWHGGLPYPIFYTMTHMLMKGCFSFTYLCTVRRKPLPKVSVGVILGASLVGVTTALDVACSNLSFLYISVTFFVMLKSASMVFILAAGAITCMERCSVRIICAVFVISSGIFLASYGEAEFNMFGFGLVLASEAFAAIRWVVTQMVLHGGKLDSMTAVFFMSPASTMCLTPMVLSLERHKVDVFNDVNSAWQYLLITMFPGFLSFLLLLVEVQLVKETSSLTLSVFGNLKSILTILLAIFLFGESASLVQWLGLAIALVGMAVYSRAKRRQLQVDALAALAYEALPEEEEDDDEEDGLEMRRCRAEVASPSSRHAEASAPVADVVGRKFSEGGSAGHAGARTERDDASAQSKGAVDVRDCDYIDPAGGAALDSMGGRDEASGEGDASSPPSSPRPSSPSQARADPAPEAATSDGEGASDAALPLASLAEALFAHDGDVASGASPARISLSAEFLASNGGGALGADLSPPGSSLATPNGTPHAGVAPSLAVSGASGGESPGGVKS